MTCDRISKIYELVMNNACTTALEKHSVEQCSECFTDFTRDICKCINMDFSFIDGKLVVYGGRK